MADAKITATVGAPPAPNNQPDVRIVQNLLGKVAPPSSIRVHETGTIDANTLKAIREFQSRFMTHPDSRVDPGRRTLPGIFPRDSSPSTSIAIQCRRELWIATLWTRKFGLTGQTDASACSMMTPQLK